MNIRRSDMTRPDVIRNLDDAQQWYEWSLESHESIDVTDHIDWNTIPGDTESIYKFADVLHIDRGAFVLAFYDHAILSDNVEDGGMDEKTEWVGSTQKPVLAKPVPVKDQEIHPVDITTQESDSDVDRLLTKARSNNPSLGISPDVVVNQLMNKPEIQDSLQPYRDNLSKANDSGDSSKVQQAKRDLELQISIYTKQLTKQVQDSLDEMGVALKEITLGVNNLSSAPQTIVSLGLPSFVGTGSPNPVKMAADVMSYKNALSSAIGQLNSAIMRFLKAAQDGGIPVPPSLITLINTALTLITTLTNLI